MIHCTTYVNDQGQALGYFMEFVNVTEEDKNGNIKPVIFSKEYTDNDTMVFFAQGYSENYTVGIVYKTEVNPDYLA
jgi:hypothetical protein